MIFGVDIADQLNISAVVGPLIVDQYNATNRRI